MIYLTALACGFLMNLMPCVLPVLALKVRAFGQPGKRWPYVAGVIMSFMVLALVSVTLGVTMTHMASETFRLTLGIVCGLMATHLLGLWHMPSFGVRGEWGPFGTGCLTVALGTSCAVPFLAPVLVYCTQSGALETFALFGAMGVGFSSPFIVPIPIPKTFSRGLGTYFEKGCGVVMWLVCAWLCWTLPMLLMVLCLFFVVFFTVVWNMWSIILNGKRDEFLMMLWSVVTLCFLITSYLLLLVNHQQTNSIDNTEQPTVITGNAVILFTADWCPNCPIAHAIIDNAVIVSECQRLGIPIHVVDVTKFDGPQWNMMSRMVDPYLPGYRSVPIILVRNQWGTTVLSGIPSLQSVVEAINHRHPSLQ